ncbi:unnamed protein product [Lactuca virosa]|uniref:Uncharacterized protein n=1 Tax=Lactuca virosa TaxID=75947 RepID=A0AAU9LVZ7_9ASTR|nr:unnamed protein product [Lactuca virosa]
MIRCDTTRRNFNSNCGLVANMRHNTLGTRCPKSHVAALQLFVPISSISQSRIPISLDRRYYVIYREYL